MSTRTAPRPSTGRRLSDVVSEASSHRPVVRPADVGGRAAWQVLLRDGVLRAVTADAACAVGTRVDPSTRVGLIRAHIPGGAVATARTAAWIHTGAGSADPFELAYPAGRHRPDRPPNARLWQSPLLRPDTVLIAEVPVTDPTRTVVELALHDGDVGLVVELARHGADLSAARRAVLLRPRVARRAEALATIDAALRTPGHGVA